MTKLTTLRNTSAAILRGRTARAVKEELDGDELAEDVSDHALDRGMKLAMLRMLKEERTPKRKM